MFGQLYSRPDAFEQAAGNVYSVAFLEGLYPAILFYSMSEQAKTADIVCRTFAHNEAFNREQLKTDRDATQLLQGVTTTAIGNAAYMVLHSPAQFQNEWRSFYDTIMEVCKTKERKPRGYWARVLPAPTITEETGKLMIPHVKAQVSGDLLLEGKLVCRGSDIFKCINTVIKDQDARIAELHKDRTALKKRLDKLEEQLALTQWRPSDLFADDDDSN